MAPELLIGEDIVSTHSDIWALAMVMLEVSLDMIFVKLRDDISNETADLDPAAPILRA